MNQTILKILAVLLVLSSQAPAASAGGGPEPIDLTGLPPHTLIECGPFLSVPGWFRSAWRIGHLPPADWHMIDEFLKAGYEVVTVNVDTYWSRVGPSASLYPAEVVKAADAHLRRLTETIHKAGARSVFYIGPVQVPWNSKELREAHPDWLRIRPDGKPDPTPNWASIRSGYGPWLLEQLSYVTRTYKVDGYWMDGYAPVHLHTYDEATRKAFREHSGGKEIPRPKQNDPSLPMDFDRGDPVVRQYLLWHEKHFVEFAGRMREAIRKENPEALIFANYSANRTWFFSNMDGPEYPAVYAAALDVPSVELYWDVPGDALYHPFVYAFVQGVTRDRGSSVWIQPTEHGISGTSSPVEIQLRGLEGIPWGVRPEFVESARREEYFRLHVENIKAREKWLRGSAAVPYIGLVASEGTRTLYGRGAMPLYVSNVLGAFRSILETHWPVQILTEYDLEGGDLGGARVLLLPNAACLSDRAAEVVRRFVANGGGLVASYETSLYDTELRRRGDFALGDLFRARYASSHSVSGRSEGLELTLGGAHPITDDPRIAASENTAWRNPSGPPPRKGSLTLVASAARVEALPGGTVLGTFELSDPGKGNTRHPAAIASEHGKGRVVYFAASVDKGMFFFPDGYMRRMVANSCRWAAGGDPPPFEVEGPLILTAAFRRQSEEGRWIVHLLNAASSWGQGSISQRLDPLPEDLRRKWGGSKATELLSAWPIREEVIPLHGIRVTCRIPGIRRASLQPEGIELPIGKEVDGISVVAPKVELHSMVVFE